MADKIIKLKLDTSQGDASIKASEALLVKLKARIAELEAELAKVDPKPIEAVGEAIKNAVAAANEPIKLDVNTDKEKIDALIASLGSAKKEAAALAALAPVVNVSTNADQVADELKSIDLTGAEVPVVVEAVGLDAVKDDIASVSLEVPPAEVPVVVDIDSAKAEIASVADDVPTADVPVQPVGIDAAKDEIASISENVPPATVGVVASGIEQVQQEISDVALDAPVAEVSVEPVDMDAARDAIASVADGAPTAVIPVEASGVEDIKNELDIEAKDVEVPVVAVGVDKAQEDIASIDSTHDVAVKVTTNIPEVQPVVDEFQKDLQDLSFEQKVELAIDASKAASTLNEVKASQKELQSLLLQSDEGSETFNRLSAAAGESKDKVDDIREAISKLSKSPIENLSGGFKSVKQSLLDLNFTQFNKDVNALGVASKKVSFKELASSVGETGKSFLSLGKIILANPIGLLVTIVTLVITNFDKLKDTLSGLAPVFDFIGNVIDGFVGTLQDLGDAIGLTSFAADEASAAALESAKNNFEELEKEGERAVALAKARGEDFTSIELKNLREQQANREAALAEYDSIIRRKGKLTDDEKKQQQEIIESNAKLSQSIALLSIVREKDLAAFNKATEEAKLGAKELADLREQQAKDEVDREAKIQIQRLYDLVQTKEDLGDVIGGVDSVKTMQLALAINKELQSIEEARINRKEQAGKTSASEIIKERLAIAQKYEEENKAIQKLLSLRLELDQQTIGVNLEVAKFDKQLEDIRTRMEALQKENIEIDAEIKFNFDNGYKLDDLQRRYWELQEELNRSLQEFDTVTFKRSSTILKNQTDDLILLKSELEQKILDGDSTDDNGNTLVKLRAYEQVIANNQRLLESFKEVDEILARGGETYTLASDEATLIMVKRLKLLEETGQELTQLEQAFLDANRTAFLDVRVNDASAEFNRLKKNLNDIQVEMNSILSNPSSTETEVERIKAIFSAAADAFVKGQAELNLAIKKQNVEQGSPMANALGVTDSELQQLKEQAVQAAVDTSRLIGDAVIEQDRRNIERQFDMKQRKIEDQNQTEIDRLELKLERGQITQETFDQRRAESDKKAAEAKLAAEKVAFEKEKQLKIKQLNIEFALELGRIAASYAVLPPGVSIIASLVAAGQALAGFTARRALVEQETFEQGGVIGEGPRSSQNEPFHGVVQGNRHTEGGEHFKIRGTNRVAELEKDEIVIRRPLAIRDRNKLLAYNAGRIKLFEDGGMIADALGTAASSFVSAAGSNIQLPPSIQSGVSPIGFAPEQNSPQVTLHVTDLERVQNGLNRTKKRVTFRS